MSYKQIIIARRDLTLSPGKLAAQVSHASMAFLSWFIRNNADLDGHIDAWIDEDILHNWINGSFTKCVLQAKNKNQLFITRDNIHYKLVLCDEKFKLEGGYNYLSFVGDYENKSTRKEGSPFGTQVDEIRFLRKEYFGHE